MKRMITPVSCIGTLAVSVAVGFMVFIECDESRRGRSSVSLLHGSVELLHCKISDLGWGGGTRDRYFSYRQRTVGTLNRTSG